MNTKDIIGCTITDILVWSKMKNGGLDEARVFIELDKKKTIGIPWNFESTNIEGQPPKGSESLFGDLSDIPVFSVNPEGKSIQEVIEAKKRRDTSILGRIKKALGLGEDIPREYKVYKTEYKENKVKYLKNQKIVNFFMFEDCDSAGYLELDNGYILTENTISPHGTGMAGLNYYVSLKSFEESCGGDYIRLEN